jgi:hypothetical protein
MSELDIRLECLRLVMNVMPRCDVDQVIAEASKLQTFVICGPVEPTESPVVHRRRHDD